MQPAKVSSAPHLDSSEADTLMLEVVKRFAAPERYGEVSQRNFLDAFYDLIDLVTQRTKAEMASLLCKSERTPRAVAHYLSLEPIAVGGRMLMHSPSLGNLDLLRIAHAGTQDHKALIAKRRAQDATRVDQATVAITSDAILQAAARGGRLGDTLSAPIRVSAPANVPRHSTLDASAFRHAMYQAARNEDEDGVTQALCDRFGLDRVTVGRVMEDQNGDALAVLLKSDSVPASEAHRLQILLFHAVGSNTANAVRAMRVYDALTVEECSISVASWQRLADARAQTIVSSTQTREPCGSDVGTAFDSSKRRPPGTGRHRTPPLRILGRITPRSRRMASPLRPVPTRQSRNPDRTGFPFR